MVLLMGITLPAGIEIVYNRTLRMYDISVFCNVGKNPRFFPRKKFYNLKDITYLFAIAQVWSDFSEQVRADWKSAGDVIGQHGYNLFVQDKSYRIKNDIGGNATPSTHHQYLVGHINIQNPATSAKIAQYNDRRVYFPATYKLSYKTDLTADGGSPSAKLIFTWKRYYQGRNIEASHEIALNLQNAWATETDTITDLEGIKGEWRVELVLTDVVGDIWFDNVMVEYGGEIQNNDPYCMEVPFWWRNVDIGEGVVFDTVYPT